MRRPRVMRSGLMAAALLTAATLMPSTAAAADSLGYPWPGAVNCAAIYGQYSWCIGGAQYSTFGFSYRNCTDFAAYRLNAQGGDTDNTPPHRFSWGSFAAPATGDGNAYAWRDNTLRLAGQGRSDRYGRPWRVNGTPAAGAVAWWGPSPGHSFGHVAIVTDPTPDASGAVWVDQYNDAGLGEPSHTRRMPAPQAYLHIEDSTPLPAPKNPDLNHNHVVDIFDLSILLSQYGKSASTNANTSAADLNWNGIVDLFDLSVMLSRWGTVTPAATAAAAGDQPAGLSSLPPQPRAANAVVAAGVQPTGLSSMTLTPSAASVTAGDTVPVSVDLDAGQPTNAVKAQLVYPTDRFAYLDTQLNADTFDINTGVSAGDGTVDIDAGSSAAADGQRHLATVTFRALSSGPVPIALGGRSSVISAATNDETLTGLFATVPGAGGGEPTGDQPTPTSDSAGSAPGGGVAERARPRGPSRAAIARALRRLLTPTGRAARISALLRSGRFSFAFTAPAAGRVTIAWYARPQRAKRPRALLAAGAHRFTASRQPAHIAVALTAAGRAALHAGTRRLTVRVRFAPATGTPVAITAAVRLRR